MNPSVWTAKDFAEAELPGHRFVVEPMLPVGGIGVCYGKRGQGKTQLALTLAVAVANGTEFLGYPCLRGPVVWISVDMPERMVQERVQRMIGALHDPTMLTCVVADSPIDACTTSAAADWPTAVRAAQPSLIIVDTLHKYHTLDENTSATPTAVFAASKRLFGSTPAILFLHHERKRVIDTDGPIPADERFRGSGAWLDDADLGIYLERISNPLGQRLARVSFPRIRFSDDLPPCVVEMDPATLLLRRYSGESATSP